MTLRIVGSNAQTLPVSGTGQLYDMLSLSLARLSSGLNFKSLHSSACLATEAVERGLSGKGANTILLESAENVQRALAASSRNMRLITLAEQELASLKSALQSPAPDAEDVLKRGISAIGNLFANYGKDPKVIKLFDVQEKEEQPPLSAELLQIHDITADEPERSLDKLVNAMSFLAYLRERTELAMREYGNAMTELLVIRENRASALPLDAIFKSGKTNAIAKAGKTADTGAVEAAARLCRGGSLWNQK